MVQKLEIRNMTRSEVDELVDWAASEGWNPGLHDADLFWATDPKAFIAADLDSKMIGGGSTTSYSGKFGFMGFFIVRPDFRGRGLGNQIWHLRRDRLIKRLQPGSTIGMDGVFDMQDYYARGGFEFSHRNLRFCLEVSEDWLPLSDSGDRAVIKPLTEIPFNEIFAYDCSCFPAPRPTFLKGWIGQPDSLALGCQQDGGLRGFGVARKCREGVKIGPLFSDDIRIADTLFTHLAKFATGGPVYLDTPESNPAALELVQRHGMTEVFGCARMYLGPKPDMVERNIFGVTTFELG